MFQTRDATPALSDTVPALSDVVPALSDAVPALSDAVPALSDTVPALSDAVPALSDAIREGSEMPIFSVDRPILPSNRPIPNPRTRRPPHNFVLFASSWFIPARPTPENRPPAPNPKANPVVPLADSKMEKRTDIGAHSSTPPANRVSQKYLATPAGSAFPQPPPAP